MFGWFKKKSDPAPQASAPQVPGPGPDFSSIDSLEKAQQMFREGNLEKLYLMPLAFGGQDIPMNVVYVPVGIAAIKDSFDTNVIGELIEAGKVRKYNASPQYQGDSFIPIAVKIVAHDPGQITQIINIWGDALSRKES